MPILGSLLSSGGGAAAAGGAAGGAGGLLGSLGEANPMKILGSTVGGIFQAFGAKKAKKKRQEAEAKYEAAVAGMKPDEGIMDVYNKSLARYNPNAYQSAFYNQQKQNVLGQQAAGISALQDRRSALAGIPSITQASNRALQNAGVAAEQQQAQQLGQLSSAASAVAGEKKRIENLKLGILGKKAAELAKTQNALTQGAINMGTQALGAWGSGLKGLGDAYGNDSSS